MQNRNQFIQAKHLLATKPGVVAVGYGYKRVNGNLIDALAVLVYVHRKVPLSALSVQDVVPQVVAGLPTDVIEVPTVDALAAATEVPVRRTKRRPCPGGFSCGHPSITAGTIGLPLVYADKEPCFLTNTHVAAPHWARPIAPGDPVLQPGPYDGGTPADSIGHLLRWKFIQFDVPNQVDAALVEVFEKDVLGAIYGAPRAREMMFYDRLGEAEVGQKVAKSGRTTGWTLGRVTATGAAVNVRYLADLIALFTEQIEVITDEGGIFSAGGDSGSAIVSRDGRTVYGLLFAGDGYRTYFNPIELVKAALGFELPETVAGQLAPLGDNLVQVWDWDNQIQTWRGYDPSSPQNSSLRVLVKGKGYFIKVISPVVFDYHGFIYNLSVGYNLIGWQD